MRLKVGAGTHTGRVRALNEDAYMLPHTNRLAEVLRRSNEVIYDQAQKDPRQAGMGDDGGWCMDPPAHRQHRACRRQPRVSVARRSARAAANLRRLIAAANDNGAADNITVVVVEVTGGWWRRFSNRWTRSAKRHVVSGFPALSEVEGSRTSREVCRS